MDVLPSALEISYICYDREGQTRVMNAIVWPVRAYYDDVLPLMIRIAVGVDLEHRMPEVGMSRSEFGGVRFHGELQREARWESR